MNALATLFVVSAVIVAIMDWIAVGAEMRYVEYVAKPATMLLLIGAAFTMDLDNLGDAAPAIRTALIAALVFSLAGDILLMLPFDAFIAGVAAFMVAHIAYITEFSLIRIEREHPLVGALTIIGIIIVLAGVAQVGRFIVRGAVRQSEKLRGPVSAYVAIISMMVVAGYSSRVDWLIAGALLFYASDAMLGWIRFVRPIASGRVLVMITYHVAQILLVVGVAAA